MFDELGNLQSEGHGISGFETMLSIGLGQEQQFTLILQTLQQLKDVYGDSVDKIVQGNTSNIIFLKSTDDSMIQTLSTMSGKRHRVYKKGKTVTEDVGAMTKFTATESKVSISYSNEEEPVISYNDMAFIQPCNSILFRAGDPPIWNRNETALPMSWRLFKNTITNPGKEYTLQTIPTLSTAKDFDVKQNQPNFTKMFDKRLAQASKAMQAMQYYKDVYGYSDDDIQRLDVDVYADEIMELISMMLHPEIDVHEREEQADAKEVLDLDVEQSDVTAKAQKDDSVEKAIIEDPRIRQAEMDDRKIFANGQISKADLYNPRAGGVNHSLDDAIASIYHKLRNHFSQDSRYFKVDSEMNLLSASGEMYIRHRSDARDARVAEAMAEKEEYRVYAEGNVAGAYASHYEVTDAFYRFLASFDSDWTFIRGEFSRQMAVAQKDGRVA